MSSIPVVPIAVSVSLCVAVVVLLAIICVFRRRKQEAKYKQYSQVAKTTIQPPEFSVRTEKQIVNQGTQVRHLKDTLGVKMMSSEESLSPLSSDDTFYDAVDKDDGRRSRSISSREPSPASAVDDDDDAYDDIDEVYPEHHIGRLWFTVQYNSEGESLIVTLVKARNLPYRSKAVKTCDPFVKISLLPNDKYVAQSRYKRKTNRPLFNETFYIHLPLDDLERCTLRFTILDGYRVNQQTEIGEVLFPLIEMDTSKMMELWRDLEKPVEKSSEQGDIHISLSYYPTLDRLTIIILRATNLNRMSARGTDPFVKVSFSIGNKIMKTKKTAVHQDTLNPLFNDAFNFNVTEDDLSTSTLLVSVLHSGGGVREDKLIGRVLLGGRMYARGKECDHWTEMMTNPRKMIKYWHPLG